MAAQHIQAQVLGGLDVSANRLVAGVGVQPIRVERLVERAPEVDRLAIQEDILIRIVSPQAPGDGAQAKVRADRISILVAALRRQPHRADVEVGIFR